MNRRARDFGFLALGAVLMVLAQGLAQPWKGLELEAAIGRSEFCCLQDGVWWQSPFGFNGSLHDFAFEVGARQRFGDWSVHAAYVNLGAARGANVATMRDDDFGRYNTSQPCDTSQQKNCLGYFTTHQQVAGVLLGAAYGRRVHGILVEGEIGQYFYKSDISVSIWCPNCGLDQRFAFGAGGTFSYSSDLRRSPYVGLKLGFKDFFLLARRFSNIDGGGKSSDGQFATCLTCGPVSEFAVGMKWL